MAECACHSGEERGCLFAVTSTRYAPAVPVGVIVYADGIRMIYQVDPQSVTKLAAAAEKDKDPMKQTCWGPQC
jgi:hypothetical protein